MIICCGESLIDMIPAKLADGGDGFLPVAGGSIFNTAIALGRLEQEVGFLAGISTDMFGDVLLDRMQDSGVSSDYVIRLDNPTTMAYVKLVNGSPSYSFNDENTAGRMLQKENLPVIGEGVDAFHFGGFSLATEPNGSTYEYLLNTNADQTVMSFDPNIRPTLIPDEAAYRERLNHLLMRSDIVKVSEEDLEWIAPDIDISKFVKSLLDRGVKIVTITMGSAGARCYTAAHEVTVPAFPVTVKDTVGAGDTFNAGFLAKLNELGLLSISALETIDAESLTTALTYASKAAAFTVGQHGANSPRLAQLIS